jgi:hypothetical protein
VTCYTQPCKACEVKCVLDYLPQGDESSPRGRWGICAPALPEVLTKYLQPCLDKRHHFAPFVVSVDVLVGKEARTVSKTLAENQAHKIGKLYSYLCGFLRARLCIVIVRASHMLLRRSRVLAYHMIMRRPQWDYAVGIGLLK